MDKLIDLLQGSGLYNIQGGQAIMIVVCLGLLYLAINKKFEPLLLVPIGFGGILANIPEAGLAMSGIENAIYHGVSNIDTASGLELVRNLAAALNATITDFTNADVVYTELHHAYETAHNGKAELEAAANIVASNAGKSDGMLNMFYNIAIASGAAPLIIFMGVGAMTDFGPLLANPKTLFLGAAAQFGIFAAVLGAIVLSFYGFDFTLMDAASIGIIGGADGPTAIYVTSLLSPHLLGPIAVAAYSYMALVPVIQPPIMKLLTTEKERKIKMSQLRTVTKREKIFFPIAVLLLVGFFIPDAAPLLGMFCLGNLMKESGVVDRLSDTAQNALINIVTIFLGLSVGSKLNSEAFLNSQTLGILVLGIAAFAIGTACGVLMAKLMNVFGTNKINPLIGSAGVSAVPMAARVSNKVGLDADPHNFLLMHAMGPNVAGVIGSAVAAGVMISYFN
jgi:carboxybiotin decarboxylase